MRLEWKAAESLIICGAPEENCSLHLHIKSIHLKRLDGIPVIKHTKDKQGLGMNPGKIHFITLYSNNSTPIDKLDVVLRLSKCYVGSRQTWLK